MAEEVFDGFDHTRYRDEATERWGAAAYEKGDRWWRSLSEEERAEFQQRQLDIGAAYGAAHLAGEPPDGDEAQAITQRHYAWLSVAGPSPSKGYFTGLGEMYVADPRFTANYDRHGAGTAEFVRDAMRAYAERHLGD